MTRNLPFNPESRWRKAAGHTAIEVDGQMMLMSEFQKHYFSLDDIGSDIWRKLENPQTIAALSASLATDYDATREAIEQDLTGLLRSLQSYALVEILAEPSGFTEPRLSTSGNDTSEAGD